MFEYLYGKKLSKEKLLYYRDRLISTFARGYDVKSNRLWNCFREKSICMEFEDAKKLNIPDSVLFYLERQNTHKTKLTFCS